MEKNNLDLPKVGLIEEAAKHLQKHLKGEKAAVYLVGHGAIRDWYGTSFETRVPLPGSVGDVFSRYNENIAVRLVGQSDLVVARLRPLYPLDDRDLIVRGAKHAVIFDTSVKEKEAPSLISPLFLFLPNMDVFGIEGYLWTSVTYDYYGYTQFPIDHVYKRLERPYRGLNGLIEDISREDIRETLTKFSDKIGPLQDETLKWLTDDVYQKAPSSSLDISLLREVSAEVTTTELTPKDINKPKTSEKL